MIEQRGALVTHGHGQPGAPLVSGGYGLSVFIPPDPEDDNGAGRSRLIPLRFPFEHVHLMQLLDEDELLLLL